MLPTSTSPKIDTSPSHSLTALEIWLLLDLPSLFTVSICNCERSKHQLASIKLEFHSQNARFDLLTDSCQLPRHSTANTSQTPRRTLTRISRISQLIART